MDQSARIDAPAQPLGNPQDAALLEALAAISDLRRRVELLERRIDLLDDEADDGAGQEAGA